MPFCTLGILHHTPLHLPAPAHPLPHRQCNAPPDPLPPSAAYPLPVSPPPGSCNVLVAPNTPSIVSTVSSVMLYPPASHQPRPHLPSIASAMLHHEGESLHAAFMITVSPKSDSGTFLTLKLKRLISWGIVRDGNVDEWCGSANTISPAILCDTDHDVEWVGIGFTPSMSPSNLALSANHL
ncbi:hypothetical protein JB92DRAFT_3120730 [Gautieria morchelliformis]|nr:hypothetical protein JB92DRAFT_3120730 [Gautieria morchelliformis]